jgi:hypothetical protein
MLNAGNTENVIRWVREEGGGVEEGGGGTWIVSGFGPMKTIPSSLQRCAKLAFSDKNPYLHAGHRHRLFYLFSHGDAQFLKEWTRGQWWVVVAVLVVVLVVLVEIEGGLAFKNLVPS